MASSTAELRASDADRRGVEETLRQACAAGRLTLDELAERVERVQRARTCAELEPLVADLPSAAAHRPGTSRWTVAVMGSAERRGRWRPAPHTTAVALMGGCTLDLCEVHATERPQRIRALAVMGGVEVVVPPGVGADVRGLPLMGGVCNRAHGSGEPQVRVRALALMGGVKVRQAVTRAAPLAREIARSPAGASR
jgi:hypothetical protein